MRCSSFTGVPPISVGISVMGDQDRYRTGPDHRLRDTAQDDALDARLAVSAHDHEVMLAFGRMAVDALGRISLIEHDLYSDGRRNL